MKPDNPYHRSTFKINMGIYANLQEREAVHATQRAHAFLLHRFSSWLWIDATVKASI